MGLALASMARAADTGLVGWWKLDERTGLLDSSGLGNNGSTSGSGHSKWVAGRVGGAWQGDETEALIRVPNSQSLNLRDAVTVAMWVCSTGDGPGQLICKGAGLSAWESGAISLRMDEQGRRLSWRGRDIPNQSLISATALPADEWVHVAVTFDVFAPGDNQRIYINGRLDCQNRSTLPLETNTMDLFIGADPAGPGEPYRWFWQGMLDDIRIYSRALSEQQIEPYCPCTPDEPASAPSPEDGATDVATDDLLGWKPGVHAGRHDVFLGTVFDDVNTASRNDPEAVLVSQGQDANTFDPVGLLQFGRTYYWRVDEVNATADATTYKGHTWSFTAEPYAYPLRPIKATASSSQAGTGPEKTIDGSGLDGRDRHSTSPSDMWISTGLERLSCWIQYEFDQVYKLQEMWVWNSNQKTESTVGLGVKDLVIETSTDGKSWTALSHVPSLEQAPGEPNYTHSTTVDLGGALARYVRLTVKSGWGKGRQYSLSEVRFFQVPTRSRGPQPAAGATAVALDATLGWRPGREAARHEVYLSTSREAVAGGTAPVVSVAEHGVALASFSPQYGRTYYWRVDEVNEAATSGPGYPRSWTGDTWSFTTIDHADVDDFEQYDDACNRIFFSWIDGFGHDGSVDCGVPASAGNGTGSRVGNADPPFAERKTVFTLGDGRQSMPFWYDNSKSPFYSEIVREFAQPRSLTGDGVDSLAVWFWGTPSGFAEVSSGRVVMNGIGVAQVPGNALDTFYIGVQDSTGKLKVATPSDRTMVASGVWYGLYIPLSQFSSAGVDLGRIKRLIIGVGNRSTPKAGGTGKLYIDDIQLRRASTP
jgi:hypothetical protein